ncbi:MAG: hypothetical protein IT176_01645 [Acidobacteria bacterium]|nr:hypothetical protein [Acidobacteriota bacterium]
MMQPETEQETRGSQAITPDGVMAFFVVQARSMDTSENSPNTPAAVVSIPAAEPPVLCDEPESEPMVELDSPHEAGYGFGV